MCPVLLSTSISKHDTTNFMLSIFQSKECVDGCVSWREDFLPFPMMNLVCFCNEEYTQEEDDKLLVAYSSSKEVNNQQIIIMINRRHEELKQQNLLLYDINQWKVITKIIFLQNTQDNETTSTSWHRHVRTK